ncbi:hypothetical protein KNU54_gp73 [Gordonia phage VanDeWege]|uniref:Uncharacterized protein n=3 Tax=Wizardvirus TaxID=2169658 RepID=A0A4Y5TZJ2_9CAUD|nr:hypothetical protein KNU54_gp73 [Gordonia phage VanDeWege]YP_010102323.1 hypothetical protein KNU56_gp72 [Gordonia phage Arri]YP_010103675.1 hypothetical protein KNU68_gp71 [Gordonia phage Nubi]QDB74655.1 hypothetical protein SEA_VANDEWEGE_73 [Gordonia phage VanDeWege]QDB74849.1 hypothetical protein SEA_ARRI_72 [Gordonia phage Arri]QDH85204.1 hypothetical protein SEA_NUBI_71 [Gordonia phage Nubi]
MSCTDCGANYPADFHRTNCARAAEFAALENQIAQTIHAHAFVPLDTRYRIARQLIADGWRPPPPRGEELTPAELHRAADAVDYADAILGRVNDARPAGSILIGFDLDYLADVFRSAATTKGE